MKRLDEIGRLREALKKAESMTCGQCNMDAKLENITLKKRCEWLEGIMPNVPKLCAHYIDDDGGCAINKIQFICEIDCMNGECKIGEWELKEFGK